MKDRRLVIWGKVGFVAVSLALFAGACGSDSENTQQACPEGCDDGVPCTRDSCDEATGQCRHEVDDSLCGQGETCDVNEGCVPVNSGCSSDTECDDQDACTEDHCSADGTCEHSAVANPPPEGPAGDATCSNGIDEDCDGQTDMDDEDCHRDEKGCLMDGIPDRSFPMESDETFDLGPYLMHVTQTSIVIMWRTAQAADSVVRYGLGDELDQSEGNTEPTLVHEVELTGLEPNTRYAYQVVSGERESMVHHFVTAPEPAQAFRFVVWGDSRSNPDGAAAVVSALAEFHPYINVNVGDVVENGTYASQWKTQWFDPIRPLAHEISTYVAIGNHERDAQYFYELHSYPHPADDPGHESFYSFTYGNAFFLVVDTNKDFYPDGDQDTPISQWIREQAASPEAQNATWRFAFAHHPGYSEGWSPCTYDGEDTVRNFLLPVLSENGFHFYFAGHTHDYERGFRDGIVQIITGGGGSALDDFCTDFEHVTVFAAVHHYVALDVDCDRIEVRAVDVDGNTIDHFALEQDQPGEVVELGN